MESLSDGVAKHVKDRGSKGGGCAPAGAASKVPWHVFEARVQVAYEAQVGLSCSSPHSLMYEVYDRCKAWTDWLTGC